MTIAQTSRGWIISYIILVIYISDNSKNTNSFLPKLHVAPEYPGAQTHTNWFTRSTHVLPFVHGLDEHSLKSYSKSKILD